jgi:hypothetical protein
LKHGKKTSVYLRVLGCEPTYEELKLTYGNLLMNTGRRCEPTYEELKQGMVAVTFKFWVGCEPTYEELKPVLSS